jgi:pilus assembly protein Flp/PilA
MLKFFRGIARCQKGATAVEYGLILALIAVGIILSVNNLADNTGGMWNRVSNDITSATNQVIN